MTVRNEATDLSNKIASKSLLYSRILFMDGDDKVRLAVDTALILIG